MAETRGRDLVMALPENRQFKEICSFPGEAMNRALIGRVECCEAEEADERKPTNCGKQVASGGGASMGGGGANVPLSDFNLRLVIVANHS